MVLAATCCIVQGQHIARHLQTTNLPIPTLDVSIDKSIVNIIEYAPTSTRLHTTAVRLSTRGENLLLAYTKHNSRQITLRKSSDGGQSWSTPLSDNLLIGNPIKHISMFTLTGRTLLPKEYRRERRLSRLANRNNLILFFEGYPIKAAISPDNGEQWLKTFNVIESSDMIVTSMIKLNDGVFMALLNSGKHPHNGRQVIYKSYSQDGGLTWTYPEIAIKHNIYSIENACIARLTHRNKKYLVVLANEQKHQTGVISVSTDEGKTWSYPVELPSFIQGDRYSIATLANKMYIVYRDTYGNKGQNNPTRGDLMLWSGTMADLEHGGKSSVRVRLADLPSVEVQQQNEAKNRTSIETPTINILAKNRLSIIVYGMWDEKLPPNIRSYTIHLGKLERFNHLLREKN
jgi:Neuraminidase (sialidase)